jgi:hypothetical protein
MHLQDADRDQHGGKPQAKSDDQQQSKDDPAKRNRA